MTEKSVLIKELENGVFKRIHFLENSKYFISEDGRILSLNSDEPRQLDIRKSSAGISVIVLYTPKLQSFNVASLILRVYRGEPSEKDLLPEYIDGETDNCKLDNLKWGNKDSSVEVESNKAINTAISLFNSRSDTGNTDTYLVNAALRNSILNSLLQISRHTILTVLVNKDVELMNTLIDEITRTVNTNIIVIDSFHKALPENLIDDELTKIIMELKNDVETNISLYSGNKS